MRFRLVRWIGASLRWMKPKSQESRHRNLTCVKAQVAISSAMTGTPVENTLLDFWNIMDFVEPGLLGGKQEFAKRFKVQADDVTMLKAA